MVTAGAIVLITLLLLIGVTSAGYLVWAVLDWWDSR